MVDPALVQIGGVANATLVPLINEGTVRPLAYSAAIKDLKALIHNL